MKNVDSKIPMQHQLPPKIWKRDEMLTFLDIFESTFHSSVSDPFDSESDMWECISDKLLAQGYTASAQHCQRKWNFLYKTYTNNQNTQGVYYNKIKRIVEFSQQLNEQSESVELNEETELEDENEIGSQVKQESCDVEVHLAVEMNEALEQAEPIEAEFLAETLSKPNEKNETLEDPSEDSVSEAPDTGQKEPTRFEPLSGDTQITDILLDIVKKMEVIQKVQIDQGQRLKEMESLHLQNRLTLLEIKKHLNID